MSLEKALEIINEVIDGGDSCGVVEMRLRSVANHVEEEIAAKKPPPRKPVYKCPNGCFKEGGQCAGVEPGFDVNAGGSCLFSLQIDQYGDPGEIDSESIEINDIDWDETPRCGNCSGDAIHIERWQ